MLKETGKIVKITDDSLWVDTVQKSTCGSCVAQKGCGQSLLNRWGRNPFYLRVPLMKHSSSQFRVGDYIQIAIPDDIIVKNSLLLYLFPLIFLLVFSGFAHTYSASDGISIFSGIVGFVLGGFVLRIHSYLYRNDARHQPFVVAGPASVNLTLSASEIDKSKK